MVDVWAERNPTVLRSFRSDQLPEMNQEIPSVHTFKEVFRLDSVKRVVHALSFHPRVSERTCYITKRGFQPPNPQTTTAQESKRRGSGSGV